MTIVKEKDTTTLATYNYDSLSRRSQLTLGGGLGSQHKVVYQYTVNDRLTDLNHHLGSTTPAFTFDYGYNDSGQLTSLAASDTFYLGKPRATETYTVNNLNQYSNVGGYNLNYDQNGNLTRWDSPEYGVQRYSYDIENRLQTAALNGSTSVSAFYDYDGLGRRVYKRTGATEGAGGILSGGTQTFYLLDGDEEIAEYDQSGNVLRRYVTGPAIDDRIAMIEGSSTSPSFGDRHFYHTNHQGSVVTTATQTGTVIDEYAYDEYGNLTDDSRATTEGQPFRYTGRRYDEETGLYYYRARYYSPELGRFLQTDPIGYGDDINLYAYVKNDPLNMTDPYGEFGLVDPASTPDPTKMEHMTVVGQDTSGKGCSCTAITDPAAIGRFLDSLNPTNLAVGLLIQITDSLSGSGVFNESSSEDSDSKSGAKEGRERKKGDRMTGKDDAEKQFQGIQKEQNKRRKEGDNVSIDSIEKSKQRANNALKPHNIDLDNLDDYL